MHSLLLDEIARDLQGGDPEFPTSMRLALAVRQAIADENLQIGQLVDLLEAHPLIAARILRLANCVTFNPGGAVTASLKEAIQRIGLKMVRSVVLVVAMDELRLAEAMRAYSDITDAIWFHAVEVAGLCRVVAGEMRGVSPDDALLAGLVSNLGCSYLLYRAVALPDYAADRERLIDLLSQLGRTVGTAVCAALELPATIVAAQAPDDTVLQHDGLPRALYVARAVANNEGDWPFLREPGSALPDHDAILVHFADALAESRAHCQALAAAWLG